MIKIFEEYVEFVNNDGQFIYFNGYSKVERGIVLNNFLKVGEWYRIRMGEYKSQVIKVSDILKQPGITVIAYNSEYYKGDIVNRLGHRIIDTSDNKITKIEHLEILSEKIEKEKRKETFKKLNIKIGDNIKVSREILKDRILKVVDINEDEYSYLTRVKGSHFTIKLIDPLEVIENLGSVGNVNPSIDPYGEEDWDD